MKILLTGGSGLLGRELQKLLDVYAPTSQQFDVTADYLDWPKADLIIHAAAYTDVLGAEGVGVLDCMDVNFFGTQNMAKWYNNVPFVYISSEYAQFPKDNIYALSKYLGEEIVKKYSDNYLIIRTSFSPRPFPHERAFTDQYTQGDYVDKIAKLIANEIVNWNWKSKTTYVGTGRKTMFELARQTKPNIKGISVDDIKEVKLPYDYK